MTSDPAEKNSCCDEGFQHPQTLGPLYEELQPKSTPEYQDLFELEENVAYGPIAKNLCGDLTRPCRSF